MTAAPGRIIVIGGSIAGLFAAILLRRLGWRVDIYERSGEALASRGAGITTHDELYAAFRQAGVIIDRELAIESSGRSVLDHSGAILDSLEMPQLMTSWGLLYRFLRERIPGRALPRCEKSYRAPAGLDDRYRSVRRRHQRTRRLSYWC